MNVESGFDVLTVLDVIDHRVERIHYIVCLQNTGQCILRLVPTTGTPTNVVTLEQRHFGAGICVEDVPHPAVGTDLLNRHVVLFWLTASPTPRMSARTAAVLRPRIHKCKCHPFGSLLHVELEP